MLQSVDNNPTPKRITVTTSTTNRESKSTTENLPPILRTTPRKGGSGNGVEQRKTTARDTGKTPTRKKSKNKIGKCRACRKSFRGTARKVFCSDGCRIAYHKRAKAAQQAAEHAELRPCLHCGVDFIPNHDSRLYCKGTCKKKACITRRQTAIEVWAWHWKCSLTTAADVVDKAGMKHTATALNALGYSYDVNLRHWQHITQQASI